MLKVLIVDPLDGQNASIAHRLIGWGHEVERAASCAQAVTQQVGSCWHLIFVGLNQLAAEGIEWIHHLRRLWPPALLIVVADADRPDLELQVRSQSIDFYLQQGCEDAHLSILMQHFEKRFAGQRWGTHSDA